MKKISAVMVMLFLYGGLVWAQGNSSLFSDIKAHQVGDVLSVIIMENANASRETKSKSRSSSEAGIEAGSKGNIANFLPVFGGNGKINSDYSGEDGTQQNDRITGRITVRIVERMPNGTFKIKGEREIGVNGKENLMKLEGYVRPRDITTENTVYSYNVADAKIIYRKSGIKNAILGPGTTTKFFTWILGGLMVAASAGYFAFK